MNRRDFLKYSLGVSAGALVASYPVFIERYMIAVNHYDIPVPNLPSSFEDFTICQISDIHYGLLTPMMVVDYVLKTAMHEETDIIACTGDYTRNRRDNKEIDAVWDKLDKLKAKHGVYSILGNHDEWAGLDHSIERLENSGQSVRHKSKKITIGKQHIWIGGAGDLWTDKLGVDMAFEHVPHRDCKILLAHNPDTVDRDFDTRVDLVLSGHTHGGQVNVPFYGPLILPVKNKKYSHGFFATERSSLFISRGIGWAIVPIRFNCPPEIAILHLKRKDNQT
jgi:predicted MPP superfamily phosphohydrolase